MQILDTSSQLARPLRTAIRNIDPRLEMGVRDGMSLMPLRTVMCFVGLKMAISVRDGFWGGKVWRWLIVNLSLKDISKPNLCFYGLTFLFYGCNFAVTNFVVFHVFLQHEKQQKYFSFFIICVIFFHIFLRLIKILTL